MAKKFLDIHINGNKNPNGTELILDDSGALENAFKIWMSYAQGESLRNPSGGWLVRHLNKPMSQERALDIRQSILDNLEKSFTPRMTILSFTVTPDYERKKYVIEITAYSPQLQVGLRSSINVNARV